MIHEILPVGMLQCNCSIFGDEESREAIVVDPGDDIADIAALPEVNSVSFAAVDTYIHGQRAALRAIGYDADPLGVFASFIFAQVAGTVFLVPGGLGTFEASSVAMLTLFKVPVEAALTATLLLRGFTYWLPMEPGYWLSHREIKKKVPAAPARAA